ncbi:hypothetical protein LZ30DRAFT_823934 [Colletotrichum cereale]|nr:hypothetical protein LZ30DRAFT_823934 [Colletotrichum cereale]
MSWVPLKKKEETMEKERKASHATDQRRNYRQSSPTPLFAAAVILHPRFRIGWLEATWATEEQVAWVRDAKVGIKGYFARWHDTKQQKEEEQPKSALLSRTLGNEDDHYT